MKGIIARILPFSSVDGPGNRSVVFLQGCNYNCLFCHNPETIPILKSADEMDHVTEMTVEEVIAELDKVKVFTSGVTISGGECTVQFEFLMELLKALKDKEYQVYLDSNGNVHPDKLEQIMPYVDKFMIDMKAFGEEEHKALTGVSNKLMLNSLHAMAKAGKLYEIRTVIIPDVLDNMKNVIGGAEFIASYDPNIRYKIIKYRQHGVRKDMLVSHSPTDELMKDLYEVAERIGCRNILII